MGSHCYYHISRPVCQPDPPQATNAGPPRYCHHCFYWKPTHLSLTVNSLITFAPCHWLFTALVTVLSSYILSPSSTQLLDARSEGSGIWTVFFDAAWVGSFHLQYLYPKVVCRRAFKLLAELESVQAGAWRVNIVKVRGTWRLFECN